MLRYIPATDLSRHPKLARTMFADRAAQFRDRLGWPVSVGADGGERDQYDALDPIYVIWERADGSHGGSLRLLPTTGRTMVEEHFLSLTDGVAIRSPHIWECTRFCLAPAAESRISAALMLGALEFGLEHDLSHAIGVFDARMTRVYARLGWGPAILGSAGTGADAVSVGLWAFEEELRPRLQQKAGLSGALVSAWHERTFGASDGLRRGA